MSYKRLTPCILIHDKKAVRWFDDKTVIAEDVVQLAKHYCAYGADELIVFDLSTSDEDHDDAIELMRKINRVITIPMVAGGNIRDQEDVRKILYAGAKRAILNFSKAISQDMLEEVSKRFGKEKIGVSLNDFDGLFKRQHQIAKYSTEVIFMHRLDLNSVLNVTDIPCVVLTDTMEQDEILGILKSDSVKGVSGRLVSQLDMDFNAFKKICVKEGIKMTTFETILEFSELKMDEEGLVPVIVQDYKTNEVLMLEYMNEEAFQHTIKSGKMTYYNKAKKCLWLKGENSGHCQYVKSLIVDCDHNSLLAKVEPLGVACRTGNHSCFFQPIAGNEYETHNYPQILEQLYESIQEKKESPKCNCQTSTIFQKGLDEMLRNLASDCTELLIASKNPGTDEMKARLAETMYDHMVLMVEKGITIEDIIKEFTQQSF